MTSYVALLRAVNVGGTGKMPMQDLVAMCEKLGFTKVKTYIASGNVVFQSRKSEAAVQSALETAMEKYAGTHVNGTPYAVPTVRTEPETELARNIPMPMTTRPVTIHIVNRTTLATKPIRSARNADN